MPEEIGRVTVKVEPDTSEFDRVMKRVKRASDPRRLTWPEAMVFSSFLGFVAFIIEKVF